MDLLSLMLLLLVARLISWIRYKAEAQVQLELEVAQKRVEEIKKRNAHNDKEYIEACKELDEIMPGSLPIAPATEEPKPSQLNLAISSIERKIAEIDAELEARKRALSLTVTLNYETSGTENQHQVYGWLCPYCSSLVAPSGRNQPQHCPCSHTFQVENHAQ